MARRSVKRPAVRVRWELEEYTLSVFFLGRPRKKMRWDQLVASTSNKMALWATARK